MIYSFSCKNFYSFKDTAEISFEVNNKVPDNNGYFLAPSGVRLSKVETVIGPNASGKTNLLKVIPFLKWLIADSFMINPSTNLPIKPFLFDNDKNEPVELSVDFGINENIYTYSFIMKEQKIISEDLIVKNKTNQRVTEKSIFSRKWDNKNSRYELEDRNFDLPREFENLLRTNASIISTAARLNHKGSIEIFDYWRKIETNVAEAGWTGDHLSLGLRHPLIQVLDFYSEIKNEAMKKEADKLLSRFDLGLEAFDIKKNKSENEVTITASTIRNIKGQKYNLSLAYESSGTKRLLILSKSILLALFNGGIAVLDEIDVNLHPEMITYILDLFVQPESNPKNAQLIFSTHSHQILNRLDKYQIVLTEKNKNGESEAWRLDNMSGVRADDNYYAKYIAGAYGALPKLE